MWLGFGPKCGLTLLLVLFPASRSFFFFLRGLRFFPLVIYYCLQKKIFLYHRIEEFYRPEKCTQSQKEEDGHYCSHPICHVHPQTVRYIQVLI